MRPWRKRVAAEDFLIAIVGQVFRCHVCCLGARVSKLERSRPCWKLGHFSRPPPARSSKCLGRRVAMVVVRGLLGLKSCRATNICGGSSVSHCCCPQISLQSASTCSCPVKHHFDQALKRSGRFRKAFAWSLPIPGHEGPYFDQATFDDLSCLRQGHRTDVFFGDFG